MLRCLAIPADLEISIVVRGRLYFLLPSLSASPPPPLSYMPLAFYTAPLNHSPPNRLMGRYAPPAFRSERHLTATTPGAAPG